MGCKANLINAMVPVLFCSLQSHVWKTDTATPMKNFCMSAEIGDDYRMHTMQKQFFIKKCITVDHSSLHKKAEILSS